MDILAARKHVDAKLAEQRVAVRTGKTLRESLLVHQQAHKEIIAVQELFQTAVKLMYSNLSAKLGDIITEGLTVVFPQSQYKFCIEFVERRGTVEADIYLEDVNHNKYHPLDAVGGGVTDFISLLLRITYIILSKSENLLVADEPLKFIDRTRIAEAAKFIKSVCEDFTFQLIMISHIPALVEESEKVYEVRKSKGISSAVLL